MKKYIIAYTVVLMATSSGSAQLANILKNKAADGAKQGAEYGTEHAIDVGLDHLFKKKNAKNRQPAATQYPAATAEAQDKPGSFAETAPEKSLKAYSKFDFVPGEKIIAFDDFAQDNIGDFPVKWSTNASGEIMTIGDLPKRWLDISKEGIYIPRFIKQLPDNFTIEYDLLFLPPAKSEGPNTAVIGLQLTNNPGNKISFDNVPDRSYFEIDPYMGQVNIAGYLKDGTKILSNEFQVKGIQRQKAFNYHVAVWRQKTRLRVYLDENKVVDAPSLLSEGVKYNNIRFATSLNNDGSNWYISNFKYSTGLPDTRNKLLVEGRYSTTGIIFRVNSAAIQPESYGVLKEMAGILKDNADVNIKIIGHTDSDGDITSNELLSKRRAESVKDILFNEFGIQENRITTDGKGETEPAFPNTTPEGKAQNRRVQFIKQ